MYVILHVLLSYQVHLRSTLWQSPRNLPNSEAQRCLPVDPQAQSLQFYQRQNCSAHGFRFRGIVILMILYSLSSKYNLTDEK